MKNNKRKCQKHAVLTQITEDGRIEGQGQGHEPSKVWIPSIFKIYLLRHLQRELVNDH